MKLFQEFGESVEKLWRDKNYDEEIFPSIAKKALEAYFMSSALSRSVMTIGASIRFSGRYSSRSRVSAFSDSTPITTLSGRIKSLIAEPSRRNSGLEATSKSAAGLVLLIMRLTSRAVPTGTVDLSTITV